MRETVRLIRCSQNLNKCDIWLSGFFHHLFLLDQPFLQIADWRGLTAHVDAGFFFLFIIWSKWVRLSSCSLSAMLHFARPVACRLGPMLRHCDLIIWVVSTVEMNRRLIVALDYLAPLNALKYSWTLPDRVIVSAVGTLESLNKLRELVSVRPAVNATANNIQHSNMIGRLLFQRLSAQN